MSEPSHCRCCSGGDFAAWGYYRPCPGCPACAEKDARIAALEADARAVVEAARPWTSDDQWDLLTIARWRRELTAALSRPGVVRAMEGAQHAKN